MLTTYLYSSIPGIYLVPESSVREHLCHEAGEELELVPDGQLVHAAGRQGGQDLRLLTAELEPRVVTTYTNR